MAGQSTRLVTGTWWPTPQLTREMTCDPPQSAGLCRALSPGPLRCGRRFCYYSRALQIPRPLHLCLRTLSPSSAQPRKALHLQQATPGLDREATSRAAAAADADADATARRLAQSRSPRICRQIRLRPATTTGPCVSFSSPTCRRVSSLLVYSFFFLLPPRGIAQFAASSSTTVSHDC